MLINSVASLMSLTLSAGQTRLIRAPSGLPSAPVTPWTVLTWRGSSGTGRAQPGPPYPSRIAWGLCRPLLLAQLRVYSMRNHVNWGSINAKSTAGLTYQTQLLTLNSRARQQMGQEQRHIHEALYRVGPNVYGLCTRGHMGGTGIDGRLQMCTKGVPHSASKRDKVRACLSNEICPSHGSHPMTDMGTCAILGV